MTSVVKEPKLTEFHGLNGFIRAIVGAGNGDKVGIGSVLGRREAKLFTVRIQGRNDVRLAGAFCKGELLHTLRGADFNRTGLGTGGVTVAIRIKGCTSLEVELGLFGRGLDRNVDVDGVGTRELRVVHAGVGPGLVIEVVVEGVVEATVEELLTVELCGAGDAVDRGEDRVDLLSLAARSSEEICFVGRLTNQRLEFNQEVVDLLKTTSAMLTICSARSALPMAALMAAFSAGGFPRR